MIVVSPIFRMIGKIASYLLYALTLLAAFGGRFDPHYFTYPAVATLVLPYLAIATFIVAVAWLIGKRIIPGAIGFAVLALGWGAISSAVPLHSSKKAKPGEKTFSLVTYNILHTQDLQHPDDPYSRSLHYLLESDADIICLVELLGWNSAEFSTPQRCAQRDSLFEIYPYRSEGNSFDMKVLSKFPIERMRIPRMEYKFSGTSFNFWKVSMYGRTLTLALVHLPSYGLTDEERHIISSIDNSSSARRNLGEFKGMMKGKLSEAFATRADAVEELNRILQYEDGPIIICGDFNDVPGSWCYRYLKDAGYHDAFAETHFGPMHTYNKNLFLFHIDQVLYRGPLQALSLKRGSLKASDHYPLLATFAFTQ